MYGCQERFSCAPAPCIGARLRDMFPAYLFGVVPESGIRVTETQRGRSGRGAAVQESGPGAGDRREDHRLDVRHLGRWRGCRPGGDPAAGRSAGDPASRLRGRSLSGRSAGTHPGGGVRGEHGRGVPPERLPGGDLRGGGCRGGAAGRASLGRGRPDRVPWPDDPPPAGPAPGRRACGAIHAPDRGAGGDRRADRRHDYRELPAARHGRRGGRARR